MKFCNFTTLKTFLPAAGVLLGLLSLNAAASDAANDAAQDAAVDMLRDPDDLSELCGQCGAQTLLLIGRQCDRRRDLHILGVLIIKHTFVKIIRDLTDERHAVMPDQQKQQLCSKPLLAEDLFRNADAFLNGKRRKREQSCQIRIQREQHGCLPQIGTGLLHDSVALLIGQREQRICVDRRNLRAHCTSPTESINSSISLA